MTPRQSSLVRRAARLVMAATLLAAVGYLSIDQAWSAVVAHRHLRDRPAAEEAARRDVGEAARWSQLLAQQTSASLARAKRQRIAGLVALMAAAAFLVLGPGAAGQKPPVPPSIAAGVAQRAAAQAAAVPEAAVPAVSQSTAADFPAVDLAPLGEIVTRTGCESRHLIPVLHAIDGVYHYLPPDALQRLPERMDVTASQVAGVASFYGQFRMYPRGEHLVRVCQGTACHVAGASRILDEMMRQLGIPAGCDTDLSGRVTVETVGCLGCCTLAPVVSFDSQVSRVRMDELPQLAKAVIANGRHGGCAGCDAGRPSGSDGRSAASRQQLADSELPVGEGTSFSPPLEIRVGLGSCCVAGGSRAVWETLQRELRRERRAAIVKPVGCVGICHLTPLVEIRAPHAAPIVATKATPADVRRILRSLPGRARWTVRLRHRLEDWRQGRGEFPVTAEPSCQITPMAHTRIQQFTSRQVRIVTEHCGEMDPTRIDDYRARDGFVALEKCLRAMRPEAIIGEIEASGLRGRGGGGFPTAKKWRLVAAGAGDKFVVCNGDEGDPGAFMDRMVMESYPYRVLEGMAIAAYAVGAGRGVVYVRHEYPLAVERLRHAVEDMTRAGWFGKHIAGSPFSLTVEIVEGAGAFVCGEETALLESVMGRRGTPRHRPPFPAEHGLWDCPTLVNNVETFANIPWIMRHGAERFAALGTERSKGTKVFSLTGKVRRGGLIEVPLGATIREVVEVIGGGVQPGKTFKAVQIGGPSGGCIPAELADTPIDYEALRGVGAIMGSGGLVVLDNEDCMVDVARFFLEFTQRESCGHCTFCRLGTRRLLTLLERLTAGHGQRRDLDEIEALCAQVTAGSLCGLGKTAPNPVLTTLRYFRDEYEAHLAGRCPAGRCRALIRYEVTRECVGCTLCAQHCPVGAIAATPYQQHTIDSAVCTRCNVCRIVCPEHAIRVV